MHDIYDPPPLQQVEWDSPRSGPLYFSRGDLVCLFSLCLLLLFVAAIAWSSEPVLALLAAGAGALVILESWFTALGYLHRAAPLSLKARWTVFLAAIMPWLVGVGIVVALMHCLFWISDHFGWS